MLPTMLQLQSCNLGRVWLPRYYACGGCLVVCTSGDVLWLLTCMSMKCQDILPTNKPAPHVVSLACRIHPFCSHAPSLGRHADNQTPVHCTPRTWLGHMWATKHTLSFEIIQFNTQEFNFSALPSKLCDMCLCWTIG